jgi:hypothetical protein
MTDPALIEMNAAYEQSIEQPAPKNAKKFPHYYKRLLRTETHVDIYRVCELFNVGGGPVEHAIKKLFALGKRGAKDRRQDLLDAIDSLNRAIEMGDMEKADEELSDLEGTF